jgi:hemolysin D
VRLMLKKFNVGTNTVIKDFLPDALALEQKPAHPASRFLVWVIGLFFLTGMVWASVGSLDIVTLATGKVIPDGKSKLVQSLVKGKVAVVHVVENQSIEKGQLLLSLDDDEVLAEKDRLEQHHRQLSNDVDRNNHFLEWLKNGDPGQQDDIKDFVLGSEINLYLEKQAEIDVMSDKLHAELKRTELEVDKFSAILPILQNKEQNLKKLSDKNMSSEQQYLDQKQLRLETEHELKAARVKIDEIHVSLAAMTQKKKLLQRKTIQEFSNKLKTATENRESVERELDKIDQQIRSYRIASPIDGRITQLQVHGEGQVVSPAEKLMVLVPENQQLEIEALVKNHDIGFVYEGQKVQIKIDAYPFTRYGLLEGELSEIAGEAILDEQGGLVYPVIVRPEHDYLEFEGKQLGLTPGMTVTAEIITGQRKIIDYFLSPLQRVTSESIRER